jgi:hypothetical protein
MNTIPFLTDNRYSAGASGATMPNPGHVVAMYSARWIARYTTAEILPDRQGFAYDRAECRDLLIERLTKAALHTDLPAPIAAPNFQDMPIDVTPMGMGDAEWAIVMRKSGGYIYVDAWLYSEEYSTEQARIDGAPGR